MTYYSETPDHTARRHRVDFTWTNALLDADSSGTESFETVERADAFVVEMIERAWRTGDALEIRHLMRLAPDHKGREFVIINTRSIPAANK